MGIPYITDLMQEINDAQQYADPRLKDRFLLWGTPIYIWSITVVYLLFVYIVGPRYMKNRKAYSLRNFLVVYNLGLVALSVYMTIEIILAVTEANYNWICAPYTSETWKDPKEARITNVLYIYGLSKLIELMDTVLMVLKKNDKQISFLHVFHHASMLNIWFWVPTFIPGGQTWFGSWLNCVVHVFMYSYYGLTNIPALKGKLWWKKYLTTFQLVQFVITFSHSTHSYVSGCNFPVWGQFLLIGYMLIMLILFGNFYLQTYIKKRSAQSKVHQKKTEPDTYTSIHATKQNGHHNEQNGNYAVVNRANGHSTATRRH